jgi:glycolate oxidase FAD binding subunit
MVEEASCTIDGFGPFPTIKPPSVSELGELVRRCAADGQAIYPVGGRTQLELGLPPTKPGVAVDLRGLDQVIDYPARDMTITVQAGITIAKLQALLATENQQLPVDVPLADRATLGGAIATNASGPRRYGYGTLRDYVIGISFINDQGQEVKAGGRVVKNVAGYDLMKLHIGALGTLGIITQVTLKLRPLPQERIALTIGGPTETMGPILELLHGTRAQPVLLELFNRAAIRMMSVRSQDFLRRSPWFVLVGLEGSRENVLWQGEQMQKELEAAINSGLGLHCVGGPVRQLWQTFLQIPVQASQGLTFKANMLPSTTSSFCSKSESLTEELQLSAHAGNGIVIGHVDDLTLEQARTMLTSLLDAAGPTGNVVVTRCPPEWKRELPVWGKPRGDLWLMRRVKETLDPRNVFNPGRFVDGI